MKKINYRFILLSSLASVPFLFLLVAPVYFILTLAPYDDCMQVYVQNCKKYGFCRGLTFTYEGGVGHIEHEKTFGYYNDNDVSGRAYGCLILDKNPLSALQNTSYCSIAYLIGKK